MTYKCCNFTLDLGTIKTATSFNTSTVCSRRQNKIHRLLGDQGCFLLLKLHKTIWGFTPFQVFQSLKAFYRLRCLGNAHAVMQKFSLNPKYTK